MLSSTGHGDDDDNDNVDDSDDIDNVEVEGDLGSKVSRLKISIPRKEIDFTFLTGADNEGDEEEEEEEEEEGGGEEEEEVEGVVEEEEEEERKGEEKGERGGGETNTVHRKRNTRSKIVSGTSRKIGMGLGIRGGVEGRDGGGGIDVGTGIGSRMRCRTRPGSDSDSDPSPSPGLSHSRGVSIQSREGVRKSCKGLVGEEGGGVGGGGVRAGGLECEVNGRIRRSEDDVHSFAWLAIDRQKSIEDMKYVSVLSNQSIMRDFSAPKGCSTLPLPFPHSSK